MASLSKPQYTVGSLHYSRADLFKVIFWMLVGAFSLQLMEQLPISLVPLQLRWVHASDALIGFLTGSLPALLGALLNPFVGVQSDRHRGKMGRRLPYLLWGTPMVVVSLLGLGSSEFMSAHLAAWTGASSIASLKIGWVGGWMVFFVVANTYIMQAYQFLFVDVIPSVVMGRFVGFYRVVGALGTMVFYRYLLGKAEAHTTGIYLFSALLYAVTFYLLIWNVKEGEYPEPPPKSEDFASAARSYIRDCFGYSFYWKAYSLSFFFWSALVPLWAFVVFFGTKAGLDGYAPTVGLSLEKFGAIRGWGALISVPVFFAVGPLVDRFHPIRMCMVGLILSVAAFMGCFFFARTETSFLIWFLAIMAAYAVYMGAIMALNTRLFPRSKFGQFCSATQIFGFIGVIFAPILCGWLISWLHDYRYLFAWCAGCAGMSLLMNVVLYLHWQKLGGDIAYQAPGQEET